MGGLENSENGCDGGIVVVNARRRRHVVVDMLVIAVQ